MSDNFNAIDPILTAEEVAEELRISKSQVHKLLRGEVKEGRALPYLAVGRRKVVPRSVLERWKQENLSDRIQPEAEKNTVDALKGVH